METKKTYSYSGYNNSTFLPTYSHEGTLEGAVKKAKKLVRDSLPRNVIGGNTWQVFASSSDSKDLYEFACGKIY